MAVYRYFLCEDPSAASPPSDELLTIDADSPDAIAGMLLKSSQPPADSKLLWVNVLVWISPDGKQRGFQSFRVASP